MNFRNGSAGTLSVKLQGARNLTPVVAPGLFGWRAGSANPYCVVQLAKTVQRSSVILNTLQPRWDHEQWLFDVPIPPEQEMLFYNDQKSLTNDYVYNPHFPELLVKVYHKCQEVEGTADVLIGETRISILPSIFSSTSTLSEWSTIYCPSKTVTGEIQILAQYEPKGLEPQVGDVVVLAGFAGYKYYSKVIPSLDATMVVRRIRGNSVLSSYKSCEGWDVSLNIMRNALIVAYRPTLATTARTIFQQQLNRLKASHLACKVWRLYNSIPVKRKLQVHQCFAVAHEAGKCGLHLVKEIAYAAKARGLTQAFDVFKRDSMEVARHLFEEVRNRDWSGVLCEDDSEKVTTLPQNGSIISAVDKRECPPQLLCPITSAPMSDPVVAADGHSYEREAISRWLAFNDTSPMTGGVLSTKQLYPNHPLKQLSLQCGYGSKI